MTAHSRIGDADERDDLFRSRCEVTASGCWLWTHTLTQSGYAVFACAGTVSAHHYAYRRWNGPVPDGMSIDHRCHNRDLSCNGGHGCLHRRCVNPDHLDLVSLTENQQRARRNLGGLRPGHVARRTPEVQRGPLPVPLNLTWLCVGQPLHDARKGAEREALRASLASNS